MAHIAAVLPQLKTASAAPREHGLVPEDFAAALLLLLVPKLPEANLPEANLPEAKLSEAVPPQAKAGDAKLPDLPEPKWTEPKLLEPKPRESKLPETKPTEIKLPAIKLLEAKLPEAKLTETVAPDAKRVRIVTPIPRRQVQNSSAPVREEPRNPTAPEPRDAPPTRAPAVVSRVAAVSQQGRAAQVESAEPVPKPAPRMADGIVAVARIVEPEASAPPAAPPTVKSPVAAKVETRPRPQAVVIDRSAPPPEIESASAPDIGAPLPEIESVPEKTVAPPAPAPREAAAAPEPAAPSAPPAAPAAVAPATHPESVLPPHLATKAAEDTAPEQRAEPRQPNLAALAQVIAAKAAPGTKRFEIRLDPPELGRVEVHLSVKSDGKAEATLYADRPETVVLLARDSQNLERALKDAGLDVSNSSLNFSLKGQDRQGDGGGASGAHTRSLSHAVVARSEAANASLATRSLAPSSARLDIFV